MRLRVKRGCMQGRIQDLGKGGGGGGGGNNYIHKRGTGGGVPPPVTARGSGGALVAPPVGPGAFLTFALISHENTHTFDSDINLILIITSD